jgi:hypothetical protein
MKWLKELLCRHKWVNVSMYAEARCKKCGKEDIFCPW